MKWINRSILVLAFLGSIDAGYLSWMRLNNQIVRCADFLGDCQAVTSSRFSEFYGIPVAYIGFLGYILLFLLSMILLRDTRPVHEYINYLRIAFSFFGFLFSLYLVFLQLFVLHDICVFCMISAFFMTLIFALTMLNTYLFLNNSM